MTKERLSRLLKEAYSEGHETGTARQERVQMINDNYPREQETDWQLSETRLFADSLDKGDWFLVMGIDPPKLQDYIKSGLIEDD